MKSPEAESPASLPSGISTPQEFVRASQNDSISGPQDFIRPSQASMLFSPASPPVLTTRSQPYFSAETLMYALSESNLKLRIDPESSDEEEDGEKGCSVATTSSIALKAHFRGLDGGYGWVITLGSFISFMVEGAFERGEGIMYEHFLERFKQSHQLTTLPSALASTLRFLLSPVASIICNRYSIRASVMTGACLFTCGVFLTQFATSFYELFLYYGVLTGCGRALFSGPGLIVIGLYFRQRQGMASGIATSGVGFGAFILVPLIDFFFQHYGYQGAFLMLSAIALHMTVVALLYRPLSTNNRYLAVEAKRKMCAYMKRQQSDREPRKTVIEDKTLTNFTEEMKKARFLSTRVSDEAMALPFQVTTSGRLETICSPSSVSRRSTQFQKWKAAVCDNCCCQICFPVEDFNANPVEEQKREGSPMLRLLVDKAFMFYCFSTFFFVSTFKIVFVFLPTLLKTRGRTVKDASLLFSLTGLLDVFSRICFGLLIDTPVMRHRTRRMAVFIWVMIAMSVAAAVMPFMGTLVTIGLAFTGFTSCASFCFTSRTVVLVDLIGVRKLSSAFGIYMFIQGFGSLLGPPISGLLFDVYGNADYGYYLASASMAASALCMAVSLSFYKIALRRRQGRHSAERQT